MRLSDDLDASYNGQDDSISFSRPVEGLTSGEIEELMVLYLDGCCPVCWDEIPQGDIVCDSCFATAASKRA